MGSERRYLGTSRIFNVGQNHEFGNGFDIRVSDDVVEASISSDLEPERRVVISAQGADSRIVRKILATMEREGMRRRRMSGEFAVPKSRSRRKQPQPAVCPHCGGHGGNTDEDGNWKECPVCQ
jgi:hypothetical protein